MAEKKDVVHISLGVDGNYTGIAIDTYSGEVRNVKLGDRNLRVSGFRYHADEENRPGVSIMSRPS